MNPSPSLPQTGSQSPARESASSPSWFRFWLTGLVFYYPFFWASQFLLSALPALIRIAVFKYRLVHFEASLIYVFVVAAERTAPAHPKGGFLRGGFYHHLITAILVVAAAALLARVRLRYRAMAGLAVALLGQSALIEALWEPLWAKQVSPGTALRLLLFFGVLSLGLRWMLVGIDTHGYWARVGTISASLVLPPLVLAGLDGLIRGFWFGRYWLLMLPPACLLAALLVSLRPPSFSQPLHINWKPFSWAMATTLLLSAGVPAVARALNRSLRRRLQAENRAAMAAYPKLSSDLPYPKLFFQKGVNFTAEFPDTYDSEGARQMLEALPQYGINAIALVPYGYSSRKKPDVQINSGAYSWENDEGLEELSRVAHARGLKVLLKPAVWGAINLEFSSAGDRVRWFVQYGLFLEHYARLAKQIHADLFCVGGEFTRLSVYDAEWRKLITRARELYPGPLVYAANFGPEFESVTFWDALDYIGLQEYYPLPDDLSTAPVVAKVEAVQQKFQRPVVFTEAGFSSHRMPNRQPWDDSPGKISLDGQARCYEAVFRAFYHKPWFQGVYWWKVGANGSGGPEDGSHTPWDKPAMDVVARWYQEGGR